ncbi:cytochrome P450 [Paxillus ammoniavirescens]|nr:cytochrome P450 [Paxillus ammoniavirescens]
MSSSVNLHVVLALATVGAGMTVAINLFKGQWRKARGFPPLPPGPIPIPFVGNALSIDASRPWVTYANWAARYGDIFIISVLNQDIIVISSEKIAQDLLDRRSAIYSDRPYLATRDPFGWSFNFGWSPYGDKWRSQRRMFHQVFRADAALAFRPLQLREARQLVSDILKSPVDYALHIQRFSAAVIMSLVYDYEISPNHDHLVELFERGNSLALEGLTPETASVVAAFPFLLSLPEWFPGGGIRRKAALSKKCAIQMISEPFEHATRHEADGSNASAMALDLLRSTKGSGDPSYRQLVKETCATAFVAGAETSTSTLHWFLLVMLQHPEVQKRAQAEIDAVVGTDRLPDFDDRASLPYVEAILREILRMYPVVPLGLPHATTVDDVYEGLFIPKGTAVMANIWAMHRNEEIYPEPNVFKPERFFVNGELNDDLPTASHSFGFGRRMCPGRYLADASAWAAMVSILAQLNISKAVDEQGQVIDFTPEFTCGVTTAPVPFPCSITPRRPVVDIGRVPATVV